ncbi:MAG: hypothetical protein ACKVU4_00245 [Phycisphaerales bacterium]
MVAAAGRYDQAAIMLDDPKVRDLYGSRSDVLWKLDRGAVALYLGDPSTAVSLLDDAERQIETRREKSFGDSVTSWTLNDAAAAYVAEPYEDIYVNVLKLLAQLSAGNLDGGASVEARRLGPKADRLRDEYLTYRDRMESESDESVRRAARSGGLVVVNEEGDFIESPLGTYLAAVTFMKIGEREFQRVAGRRLVSSIRLQQGLIGPVREEDFAGIEEASPSSVGVLVVALSGRGPTKYAESVGPIAVGTVPVYFELPRLMVHPSVVGAARVEVRTPGAEPVEGAGGEQSPAAALAGPEVAPERTESLALIEDLSAVAAENHRRMLPLIHARTLIRAAIKAGVSATATEVARRSASDKDQGLVQVAGVIAGLIFMGATEKADVRCWMFLPGQAHVGTLDLPPGRHEVRVVYESASGSVVSSTPWQPIEVAPGGLTSVVTYYGQ